MGKGYLITFEGIDGSGKSTQIEMLKSYLEEKDINAVLIREPGGTKIGEKIRELILDKSNSEMNNITEMLLYNASRAQLVQQVIKPAITSGKVVICDRYIHSTVAYQGSGRGLDIDTLEKINDVVTTGILPDVTIFIDISPSDITKRKLKEIPDDRIECQGMEFQKKVYTGYKQLAILESGRIISIDGNDTKENIFCHVKKIVNEKLNYVGVEKV